MTSGRPQESPARRPSAAFEALSEVPRGTPCAMLHTCGKLQEGLPGWHFGAGSAERDRVRVYRDPVDVLEFGPEGLGDAFARIDAFLERHARLEVVGFLGYDLGQAVESFGWLIPEDLEAPIVHLQAHARFEDFFEGRPEVPAVTRTGVVAEPAPAIEGREFMRRVAQVVEHICAGDIFQANLTQPFTGRFDGDPRQLFADLCAVSPAPFAAYVETGNDTAVLSSSPEEFLRCDGRSVESRPIKGTRPRSADGDSDRRLLDELLHSEKDLAELAMIVDLLRNDLGKVAEWGSVKVGPFPEHASFAQVHHLFARIHAVLREGVGIGELLAATFPGGSITGAPKLRCLEILEDLEVVRRGPYTGAIGRFGPALSDGSGALRTDAHLNIAIRTMTLVDDRLRFNVGGGITADSDPASELQETYDKARGLFAALGLEPPCVDRAASASEDVD